MQTTLIAHIPQLPPNGIEFMLQQMERREHTPERKFWKGAQRHAPSMKLSDLESLDDLFIRVFEQDAAESDK